MDELPNCFPSPYYDPTGFIETDGFLHGCRRPTTDLSIAPIEEPKASWLGNIE